MSSYNVDYKHAHGYNSGQALSSNGQLRAVGQPDAQTRDHMIAQKTSFSLVLQYVVFAGFDRPSLKKKTHTHPHFTEIHYNQVYDSASIILNPKQVIEETGVRWSAFSNLPDETLNQDHVL